MNSVEEIYGTVASEAAIDDAISDLGGTNDTPAQLKGDMANESNVGRVRLWRWVVSYAIYALQVLMNTYKQDVRDLARAGHFGTKRWFVDRVLNFQYGDDLVFTPNDAYYDVDNPEAKIVGRAAVVELGHKAIVKAVRVINGTFAPLNNWQLDALNDKIQEVRPPITVVVVSAPSDRLKLPATIVYDAKQGLPGIQTNVHNVIEAHIRNLDFNGVFNLTKLKLEILNVAGVNDVVYGNVQGRASSSQNWIDVPRIYMSYSGWMTIDSNHPLDEVLNWSPSNF